MSDFLSKFTNENYDREAMKISDVPSKFEEEKIESYDEIVKSTVEEKSYKEFVEPQRDPEKHMEDKQAYIRDEPTELDPDYKRKQKKKIILASILAVIILISTGFIYNKQSHTLMPDFENAQRQEVNSWANKNKMDVIYEEKFDTFVDEDTIISQSVEAEEKIKKGSVLNMIVSLGADPDELVSLPDFAILSEVEIEEWLISNKMRYIQLDYQYSDELDPGTFINFEIKDKDVTKEKFMRKNKALLTLSKGQEAFEQDILVLDFKNKLKSDVESWMKEKEFKNKFTFEEDYDDEKIEGEVISQSIAFGEKVAKDEILSFVISKGKAVIAPDYSYSELNTFDTINTNGSAVVSKEIYTMTYPYGNFVEQSIEPGTILNDSPDATMVVHYSIGKPYINDLIGQSEGALPAFFYEFKGREADISYEVYTITDCGPKGTVVKASKNNEFVSTSDHVDVYVSDGRGVCDLPLIEDDIEG